jgi:TP901 family phage tail tape measure protein
MTDYRLKFLFTARADASLSKVVSATRRDMDRLGAAGKGLGQALSSGAGLGKLNSQLAASGKSLTSAKSELAGFEKTEAKAGATNTMLARRIGQAQRSISGYSRSLRSGTRELRNNVFGIRREITALRQLRGEYSRSGKALGNFSRHRSSAGAKAGKGMPGFSEMASVAAPVLAVSLPVKKAMEFESAMAGVRKVVDFKQPDGLQIFGQQLLRLSKEEIPISAAGLAEIAAAGGQLGVAEKDLLTYVKTTAKMAVAFDMMPDEAGDASAKLSNVYKVPLGEIEKLGDAINHLSDNTPSKAREITRAMLRVGGVSGQFGLAANQAAALSAAFVSLGKAPEVAGTAINGMLTKLMTADKGGKAFQKALSAIGYDAYELKDAIQNDAQGALIAFLEAVGQMDKSERMGVLVDLFGTEYADDISILVGSLDKYKNSLELVAKEQSYLGCMTREFNNQAGTTARKLTILGNKASALFIDSGSAQLPIFNSLIATTGGLLDMLSSLTTQFPNVSAGLAHLVGGAAAAIAVFKGLKLAGRFFSSGFKDIANLGRKGINLARGRRGKAGKAGKGGALGGLLGAASGATPVFVTNWPGGGLGSLGEIGGGGGRRTRRRGPKFKAGRKGFLAKAGGLAGRAAAGLGLASAASSPGLLSKAGGVLGKGAGKLLGKGAGKIGLKAVGKGLLKKIPGIGLLAGLGFGVQRALAGDWLGAAGEVASGAASMVPGVGTAASLAIDAGLAARDIARESEGGTTPPAQAPAAPAPELAAAPTPELAKYAGAGESALNVNIKQTVNAPGADAESLKGVLSQGREELRRTIEDVVKQYFWSQQRTGFNNA